MCFHRGRPGFRAVEDTAVTQRENTLLITSSKDSAVTLPRRPAYGRQGQELLLWGNYFSPQMESMTLFCYVVGS